MKNHRLIAAVLALGLPSLVMGQGRITVGPNVQVSKANPKRGHYETWIAADPSNPNRLLAGSMIAPSEPARYSWAFAVAAYTSFDGGNSWEASFEQRAPRGSFDPSCAYDRDGTAYFVHLANAVNDAENKILLYRSQDGGKTWNKPVSFPFADRPYVVVDTTGGKYAGQVYLNATWQARALQVAPGGHGFTLGVSRDGGATAQWTTSINTEKGIQTMGNGVVLSDGTYAAVFPAEDEAPKLSWLPTTTGTGQIWFVSSSDGGQSLSRSVRVSSSHSPLLGTSVIASYVPMLAADQSKGPFRDRLYVVWSDVQSSSSQILLSYSSDKGKTWSQPVIVNDDRPRANPATGPHDHSPTIAVNKDGVVGVAWLDRRDSPDDLGYYERFAASWDGGETFGPSVRVSEAPNIFGKDKDALFGSAVGGGSDSRPGALIEATVGYGGPVLYGGHTMGMAASADGVFHPFWVDNRTGVSQAWTARVTVSGAVNKNGSASLADLQDVTSKIELELVNPIYDVAKKTVTVDAYLENTSKSVLKAPLVGRVLSLSSVVTVPLIANSDNASKGAGAMLDFSHSLEEDFLKPGQRTKAKRLEIRLDETQWPAGASGSIALFQFLQLKMKVLGVVLER